MDSTKLIKIYDALRPKRPQLQPASPAGGKELTPHVNSSEANYPPTLKLRRITLPRPFISLVHWTRSFLAKESKQKRVVLLTGGVFLLLLLSRILFLSADLPHTHIEIEEKPSGLSARSQIFHQQWTLYQNWMQPVIYAPLANVLSYISFRWLGVGLAQSRLPFALASFLGLVAFYTILRKQTNGVLALLALLTYGFNFRMVGWNRSAVTENLYLLLMPLAVYYLTKKHLKSKDIFALIFIAGLNLSVKLYGYPFYLAAVLFVLAESVITRRPLFKTLQLITTGSLASFAVLILLFTFTECLGYAIPMYRVYSEMFGTGSPYLTLLIKKVWSKINGYPLYLTILGLSAFWYLGVRPARKMSRSYKPILWGSLASLTALVAVIVLTGVLRHTVAFYQYFQLAFTPYWERAILDLQKMIALLIEIDPYLLLAFGAALPVIVIKYFRLNKLDWFMLIFITLASVTRLLIPVHMLYWKRLIYLFFPLVYFIFRAIYLLYSENEKSVPTRPQRSNKVIVATFAITLLISLALLITFSYYHKEFKQAFHNSYTLHRNTALLLLGICWLNFSLALHQLTRQANQILMGLILSLALGSIITNTPKTAAIFLPENIKYSYQENEKYTQLIPEDEMVVAHEQAVRAFAYLSRHNFFFNHDGGPNPIPYREVLARDDLRYFILNVLEFDTSRWGMPNKVRLEIIKEAYPDLKLLGIMRSAGVPLAIYDKYGGQ